MMTTKPSCNNRPVLWLVLTGVLALYVVKSGSFGDT
jgi:hypothetical protein